MVAVFSTFLLSLFSSLSLFLCLILLLFARTYVCTSMYVCRRYIVNLQAPFAPRADLRIFTPRRMYVYRSTYLIKNQDASVLEHGARDGNPLPLSAGKLHPPLSHKRVKPVYTQKRNMERKRGAGWCWCFYVRVKTFREVRRKIADTTTKNEPKHLKLHTTGIYR